MASQTQRLDRLIASLPNTVPPPTQRYGFIDPPKSDHTAVRIGGGIGDLILGLSVAEILNIHTNDVVIHTKFPEVARYFTLLPVVDEKELVEKGLDWHLFMNSVCRFDFQRNFKGFKNPALNTILIENSNFRTSGPWGDYADRHPHLDNLLATEAVKAGLNRETLPYQYLGLPLSPNFAFNYIQSSNYITVHDGFDLNNKVSGRATKTWSLKSWNQFVTAFKEQYPDLKVVQLGGPKSRSITGVDVDLIGVPFKTSMAVLKNSLCHVDGDSGLVHAAHKLGVRSVVIFGPTNADFFGYKDNTNIKPKFCGNCWWTSEEWNDKCIVGYDLPLCMESTGEVSVLRGVEEQLNKRGVRCSR